MPLLGNKKEKVVYGLKNVHWALVEATDDGAVTFSTPIRIDGSTTMGLSQEGDLVEFYADDVLYYSTVVNNGYSGDTEFAIIPDDFRKEVLGEIVDEKGVQFEVADAKPKQIAILAEFDTDVIAKRICLYNVMCKRPDISSETKKSGVDVKTQKLSITARPIKIGDRLIVKSSTTAGTDPTTFDNWFKAVHVYSEPVTEPPIEG